MCILLTGLTSFHSTWKTGFQNNFSNLEKKYIVLYNCGQWSAVSQMHRSAWLTMLLCSVTVLLTQCPGFLGTSALTWDFHQAFSIILLTFSLRDQEWEELGSCFLVPSPSSAEAPAGVQQLRTAPPGVRSLMPHLLQCNKTVLCLSAPAQVQWVGVNTNSSLGKKNEILF